MPLWLSPSLSRFLNFNTTTIWSIILCEKYIRLKKRRRKEESKSIFYTTSHKVLCSVSSRTLFCPFHCWTPTFLLLLLGKKKLNTFWYSILCLIISSYISWYILFTECLNYFMMSMIEIWSSGGWSKMVQIKKLWDWTWMHGKLAGWLPRLRGAWSRKWNGIYYYYIRGRKDRRWCSYQLMNLRVTRGGDWWMPTRNWRSDINGKDKVPACLSGDATTASSSFPFLFFFFSFSYSV